MTGTPRSGKMSTGAWRMASEDERTMARTATRTVTGRLSALSTRNMGSVLPGRDGPDLVEEGSQVAGGPGQEQEPAPDVRAGHGVLDLRLGQQPLGVGDVHHRRQACLVARGGLALRRARR